MKQDAYTKVTESIIETLERVTTESELPWRRSKISAAFNASSHNPYHGINAWLLSQAGIEHEVNAWVTYKQAQSLGGNVRKGESGKPVVFFKMLERTDRSNPDKTVNIPMARYSTVFNVSQCEELKDFPIPEVVPTNILEFASSHADISHNASKAFYRPNTDCIHLPNQDKFHSEDGYHAVLLHELVHWTAKRVDRMLSGRFGDDAYAMEELIAEIGSTFLCAHFGITYALENHASYIKSWMKVIQADKRAVFTAAKHAQTAVDYLLKPCSKRGAL